MVDEWMDTTSTLEREILDLRDVGIRRALSLGKFDYASASPPLPPQCHETWLVLVFVLRGSQRYVLDGKERVVHGGQGLRILPRTSYHTGEWPEQRGQVAWLIFDTVGRATDRISGMSVEGGEKIMSILCDPGRSVVFQLGDEVGDLVSAAFVASQIEDSVLRAEAVRNRIAALAISSAISLSGCLEDPASGPVRIREIVDFIHASLDEPFGVDELIERSGFSAARFYEHFKAVTGCTPGDYILRMRVHEGARRLTDDADLTVTRVAHDLGFSSSQYFATVFRRYFGTTPREWRARKGVSPTSRSQR